MAWLSTLALALGLSCILADSSAEREGCDDVHLLVQRSLERGRVDTQDEGLVLEASTASEEVIKHLGELIVQGFDRADKDGDGVVTLDDMRERFGHGGYVRRTYRIFRRMLHRCTGHGNATSCERKEMLSSVKRWMGSGGARRTMAQHGGSGGVGFFAMVNDQDPEHEDGAEFAPTDVQACGPTAAELSAPGFGEVRCTWTQPKCWKADGLLAWSQVDLCVAKGCLCEPTKEAKRLAKLGVMGALAVTTAKNWSDAKDVVMAPACGDKWSVTKVLGQVTGLNERMDFKEKLIVGFASRLLMSEKEDVQEIIANDTDRTEVALFRSSNHQLVKGGEPGKVCMMSWQATRDNGDWKTNLMLSDVAFKYAPAGHKMEAPKGLVLAYKSVRDKLYKSFREQCCSDFFRADQVVISGHSHGGAMAELHAVDVVSNWQCPRGRDLGAAEVTLVTAAPHAALIKPATLDRVFSCNDPKACLTGKVVTIVAHSDLVGDGMLKSLADGGPIHPSVASMFVVPAPPEDLHHHGKDIKHAKSWYSHGIWNYVKAMEEYFVGQQNWGSTCGGHCGDPNRQVQCNQWVLVKGEGCVYANSSELGEPSQCSGWDEGAEHCHCVYDRCDKLTTYGCRA